MARTQSPVTSGGSSNQTEGSGGPGANTTTVKPPKFDGATSWVVVFHRQFQVAAVQNNWTTNEKAAHLLSMIQSQAADILNTVPAAATYEDIVGALRTVLVTPASGGLPVAVKARVQTSGENLQEFA